MLQELDDYDWKEAFGYAGRPEGTCAGSRTPGPMLVESATCGAEPFTRADVAELLHRRCGEHDGPPWLAIGRLNDGRFFYLTAGCDYTGWDCQAGGQAWVAHDLETLVQFGLDDEAKTAFGL